MIYSIFLLEIIGKLNIGFFHHGKLILERKSILKNYIKNNLIKDSIIILIIIYDLFINLNTSKNNSSDLLNYWNLYSSWPKLIIFTKIYKLKEIFYTIKEHFNIDEKYEGYIKLFSLINKILFISHSFACLWHFVGFIGILRNFPNWLTDKNLQDESIIIRYISSYNFSAVTM